MLFVRKNRNHLRMLRYSPFQKAKSLGFPAQLVDISKLGLNSKIKKFSYSFICGKGYSPPFGGRIAFCLQSAPPDARRRAFFFLCLFCAVWVLPFKRLRSVFPFSKPLVTFLFASRGDSPYFPKPDRRKNPFPLAFADGLFYNGKVRHLS